VRVLVVNDELHILGLLEKWLARAGHDVTCAADGESALEAVAAAAPDCIFLDAMMPRMDSYEVLATLRQDLRTAAIPVVMLLPKQADVDVPKVWVDGQPYLIMPFSEATLLAALGRAVADTPL